MDSKDSSDFCFKCGSVYHSAQNCQIPGNSRSDLPLPKERAPFDRELFLKRKREGQCMICGEAAHFMKNCPLLHDFEEPRYPVEYPGQLSQKRGQPPRWYWPRQPLSR